MRKQILVFSAALAGLFAAQSVSALPFSAFDPRSFAMGGAGVAAGTSANAVFFNPALLAAAREDEDFSLEFPILGARVTDPGDFVDAVDTVNANDSFTAFSNAIAAYDGSPAAQTAVTNTGNQLKADLQSLSQKAVQLEGDVAFVVGVPGKKFGISIYGNAWAVGGGVADITAADLAAIDTVIATLPGVPADPTGSFTSSVSARFATITEAGVAVATDYNGVAIGITPKIVEVVTNDYSFTGNAIDTADINRDLNEKSDSNFNFDIGVAKDYGNGWKAGVSVKNVLSKEYTTALGNKIAIDPMARAGMVYQNSWTTVAVDIDLTENDPGGFDTKTQFAAVGLEFDAFDTAQLRVGLRHNMSDNPYGHEVDTLSAGFGFSPFGAHLDFSVAGNSDEVGGSLQLGFRF